MIVVLLAGVRDWQSAAWAGLWSLPVWGLLPMAGLLQLGKLFGPSTKATCRLLVLGAAGCGFIYTMPILAVDETTLILQLIATTLFGYLAVAVHAATWVVGFVVKRGRIEARTRHWLIFACLLPPLAVACFYSSSLVRLFGAGG